MKNRAEMPVGKLKLNAVLERLWQHILVDFIMKLLISRGYDSVLVVCNRFFLILHFIAITEKTIAKGCQVQFTLGWKSVEWTWR